MPYEKKMHQSLRPETEKRFAELESSPKHQRYNKQTSDVLHRLNTFEKEVDPSQRNLIQAIITVL